MKFCPRCNHKLTATPDACPECGFVLISLGSKTLGDEDITREIRNHLTDRTAPTLTEDNVSSSDSTIKLANQDDEQDNNQTRDDSQDSIGSPTIQLPDQPWIKPNSDDEGVDQDLSFELDDHADDFEEVAHDAGDTTIKLGKKTPLVDPMQTMSRPLDDINHQTTQRPPSTVNPADAPRAKTQLDEPRLPTIINPQAALDAAEEYSKGLQSLIPPRTVVHKEQVSDSSDYQILKRIGSGAYGTVFRAKQVPLERSVAIKLLQNSTADEYQQEKIKNEFLREAQFTGRLEHPNIVPIHDIGLTVSPKGAVNPFYVMKEIRGTSWLKEIRTKTLKENLEVLKNVTNAIAFAHSQNILHCDLKPDNVMLGEFGEVLVVDWGQAVDMSVAETMRPGGTPAYISPEMAQYWIDIYLEDKRESKSQADVGFRSDVYLLGALLFETITGTAPHCKTTREPPYEVISLAAKNHIVDYSDDVNQDLMTIALRAMRATEVDHIETTGGLLAAIDQYETRSLSIELRQRAQQFLSQAKTESDYDYFQRARFSFEEAIEKWKGNDEAHKGLRDTKLSCAQQAREDQNFDLGLDMLQGADGEAEAELRKQLTAGKLIRDRRKRLVTGLAFGLAGSILLGILINGFMINENFKSVQARDEAVVERNVAVSKKKQADIDRQELVVEKQKLEFEKKEIVVEKRKLEKSIEPLKLEVGKITAKLVTQDEEFKEKTAAQKMQFEAQEEQLKREKERQERELQAEIDTLDQQKETLANEKQNLAGQVVELSESSKLLRYKSGLTQILTDLQSGDYRNARKSIAQYQNQRDFEVARLNLLAHPEIKSLYPSESITSISATADGQQLALVFPDRIEIRSVDQLDQPGTVIDQQNIVAVAMSPDGNQLFTGKLGDFEDSAGQIEVFDLTQPGQAKTIRTFPAQSVSIDLIEVNEAGNAMLSVGKTSALRQSSGQGLEEPLMVWIDGQQANVNLVLPNGAKPKFDSASFSNDGQRILLTNRAGLPREQQAHVFERNGTGYQWIASSPIEGISAATFASGPGNEVIAGIQNTNTGGHSLARWRYKSQSASGAGRSQGSGSVAIIAPLTSKLVQLRQQGDFMIATGSDRQTTIWDWRNKKSIKLNGQSRPADFSFVKPGERLETSKVVTAAIGEQAELLSIDLADYQPEFQRQSMGWTPEDRPASVTAMFSSSEADGRLLAFGNDHGMASVIRGKNRVQWNISAWQYQVACDDLLFAQSAEDYLYQYDRTSGALERVLTKLADHLGGRERVVDLQISDDGQVALVKTDSKLPKFLLWDLQQDQLIRVVDYGRQDLFGTGSKKPLPKLTLSRDGKWVVGAKVGVFGWLVNSGQLVRFTSDNADAARSIANSIVFVRNSQQVLVSWRNRIVQFDLGSQQEVDSYLLPQISDAQLQDNMLDAIADDGQIFLLAEQNKASGGVLLLSLKDKQQLAKFERASSASFYTTQNGVSAIAGGRDDNSEIRLSIWDSTMTSPRQIDLPSSNDPTLARYLVGFERVSVSSKHGILLQTTQRNAGSASRMWSSVAIDVKFPLSTRSPVTLGRLRILSQPMTKHIVTDKNQAATLANDQVMFWSLSKTGVKPDGVLDVWATAMQLSPNSKTLAVNTNDKRCVLYDFSSREKLGEFDLKSNQGDATALAWQSDSKSLAIGRSNGTIEVVKLNEENLADSTSVVLKLNTPIDKAISQLAYSQNNALLATVTGQSMAVLIRDIDKDMQKTDASTAAHREMVFRHSDNRSVMVADLSADGNRIVSGSNTGRVTIWNSQAAAEHPANKVLYATAERELMSLPDLHQSAISVVRFADSQNGQLIYSAEQNSGQNEFITWPSMKATTEQVDTLERD